MPRMKRPPVAWSRTVACFARTDGWRNVFESTADPDPPARALRWASAATVVSASQPGPPRGAPASVRWSATQTASVERLLAGRGEPLVERRPLDPRTGDALIPIETSGSRRPHATGSATRFAAVGAVDRARRSRSRSPVVTAPLDADDTSAAYFAITPPV